jgi:hypothetical protein
MGSTLKDYRSAAEICRERGWGPGTRIVGDEGYGPTVIEITAVGHEEILAKTISHNGQPPKWEGGETSWVLWCRDWRDAQNLHTLPGSKQHSKS